MATEPRKIQLTVEVEVPPDFVSPNGLKSNNPWQAAELVGRALTEAGIASTITNPEPLPLARKSWRIRLYDAVTALQDVADELDAEVDAGIANKPVTAWATRHGAVKVIATATTTLTNLVKAL